MTMANVLIQELETEAATTRRVLERVPAEHFDWRPSPRSRSLGQLALHIATTPGGVAALAAQNPAEVPRFPEETGPSSVTDLLAALERSLAEARSIVGTMDDAALNEVWRVTAGGREVMAVPRVAFLRSVMLNHWYHHRGQLTVYLRLLDVPVPSVYGPSADENPFM
jgi:uncharacterized damage-inducible protein DinB